MNLLKKLTAIALLAVMICGILSGCNFPSAKGYLEIEQGESIYMEVGDAHFLTVNAGGEAVGEMQWSCSGGAVTVKDGYVTAIDVGMSFVSVSRAGYSDSIIIYVNPSQEEDTEDGKDDAEEDNGGTGGGVGGDTEDQKPTDPYATMTEEQFYSSYTPAVSYLDAYYRTQNGFMSGSVAPQTQEPTVAANRPTDGERFVKNAVMRYSDDGNTYYVCDENGDTVLSIYRVGAYVTLEEVAAYVYAFGTVPVNYTNSKNAEPHESIWGKYLRLNNTYFSGDTSRYPYEPVLPRISGEGGDLDYYEIDIGTLGTDCDPRYPVKEYNDGYSITRGAARIVYSRYSYGSSLSRAEDKFLFYTYNHYNDFSEYLNYLGGWGEMFGNITGGGTISSRYDYAPTPYVPVTLSYSFGNADAAYTVIIFADPRKYLLSA